jgi:hypothetical protein
MRLKYDISKLDASATTLQLAKMQERKNSLWRKINAWTMVQHLYMPEVGTLRARQHQDAFDESAEVTPYDVTLYLPSSLPQPLPCATNLQRYEFRLHEAQAFEALEDLCQHLRLRSHMYKYKDKNVVGQSANTQCQNLINCTQDKVNASTAMYNRARNALLKLSTPLGESFWRMKLLVLKPEDVCPLEAGDEGDMRGRKELSWIWKVVGVSDDCDDPGFQEGM